MNINQKELIQKSIDQLERISRSIASIGESEDCTDIAIQVLEYVRDSGEDFTQCKREEPKEEPSLFWVSLLIQDTKTGKLWRCPISYACLSMEEAIKLIRKSQSAHRVLSAWIDVFEKNKKTTVFHECYVDTIGHIEPSGDIKKMVF